MIEGGAGGPVARGNGVRDRLRRLLATNSILLVALLLVVIFWITAPVFGQPGNLVNILRQMSVVATLALGLSVVVIAGGIDLSVGSVLFLSAALTGLLLQHGVPFPLAVAIALAAAALVGLVNGLVIEGARLSPVIVTLGMLIGVRGTALVLTGNAQIRIIDPMVEALAVTRLPPIPAWRMPGLPMTVVIVVLLVAVVAIVMRTTTFGRAIYAIGGNPRASHLAGIPVARVRIGAYVLSASTAGVGGVLMAASTGVVSPNLGAGIEFFAIAAVVLGGTQLSGGVGRVERSLIGAFILFMILNYMTIRRVPTEWQQAATGLILIGAVVLERVLGRRDGR